MRILFLTTLLICRFFVDSVQSQCRVSIDSPDSLAFLMTINDISVNSYPLVSLELNLNTAGKTNFKAEFPGYPTLNFSQVITIKKGSAVAYTIDRSKGTLKFILTSESLQAVAEKTSNDAVPALITADTLQAAVPHKGCFPVTDEAEYQDMITATDGQHFESKKLSLMAEYAGKSCIRTDQLRFMMSKLSQEDNKLALLQAAKGHIYDPEHLKDITSDFFLARNKAKAAEIVDEQR